MLHYCVPKPTSWLRSDGKGLTFFRLLKVGEGVQRTCLDAPVEGSRHSEDAAPASSLRGVLSLIFAARGPPARGVDCVGQSG